MLRTDAVLIPQLLSLATGPGAVIACSQVADVDRSRYPDASAYTQWTTLAAKIESSNYSASDVWSFLPTWSPALLYPEQEISQISIGGYKELYDMGVYLRHKYKHLYEDNTAFEAFANQYPASPRVIVSARLFMRGFMGPNLTFGSVYVLPSSDSRAVANSLAPSDSCPAYKDDGGGKELDTWQNIYLPPIADRINRQLGGNISFSTTDVSLFPYLCGFETQINGVESPWCDTFSKQEFRECKENLKQGILTCPKLSLTPGCFQTNTPKI